MNTGNMRRWLKDKWSWLRKNVLNKEMILPAIIAEIIFWIPVWLPAILALTINAWWWTVTGAVIAFWAGPFTPAIVLQIGFIYAIKKLIDKIKRNKDRNVYNQ